MNAYFQNAFGLNCRTFDFLSTVELISTCKERILIIQWLWFSANFEWERRKKV